jgi:hypothetical protein
VLELNRIESPVSASLQQNTRPQAERNKAYPFHQILMWLKFFPLKS